MKTSEDSNVRLRRTKSVNSVEDIKKCEEVLRKSQPDRPYVLMLTYLNGCY